MRHASASLRLSDPAAVAAAGGMWWHVVACGGMWWQGQVYAWGHNRVAQLGIGNSYTVPRNLEGAYFLPNPQLVESLAGMVRGGTFF